MAMHIFTYGSLMFNQVWSRVVQGHYPCSAAHLMGFVRKGVIGAEYPVIYPGASEARVDGTLYFNVSTGDMTRLDEFEGIYYDRQSVSVTLQDGSSADAEVYVLETEYHHIASDLDWDLELFKDRGLNSFLENYNGFGTS